jgi:hypothetical protein
MHSPGRSVLFFTLLLTAAAHAQPESQGRLHFGALHFRMSIDEARAALPEVQWTVVDRHSETGRAYVIRGARAVTLAGTDFDLEIGSRSGALSWILESNATARNAAECEERTLAVVAELERHFGAFHEIAPLADDQSRLRVGKLSSVVVSAADRRLRPITREKAMRRDPEQFWVRSVHTPTGPDDPKVYVGTDYQREKRPTCGIELRIVADAPAIEHYIFASDKILAQPTISFRNRSLRNVGVPSETLHFSVPCFIRAGTGAISYCLGGDRHVDPHRSLATDWAMYCQFAPQNAQRDDERLLAVDVPVRMGPDDLRTVNVSSGRHLDLAQVKVKKQRGTSSLSNLGLKSRTEIPLICEVMEDGSLVCTVKPGTTVLTAIAEAAVYVAEGAEVDLTLRDGTSAVGGLIERKLTFTPHE